MVLLYKVAIKNINDNRISTSSNVSQYRNLENPFWMSYWLQSSPHGKHQTFIPPKIKYLQVVGIYELEGFPSLVSQGEAGGRSGSSWSRFLAQEASGGSWLRWSDRRDWFQKEVKRCTCWVLELTVLYIYTYIYICLSIVYCILLLCFVFSNLLHEYPIYPSSPASPAASPTMPAGHRTNWATQKGEWRMSWSTYQAWTGPLRDSGWLPILMEEYVMLYVDKFGMYIYIVGST